MKHDRILGYSLILIAMMSLGSSLVAGKLVVAVFPKTLALGFRVALACIILLPVCLRQRHRRPRLDWRSCGLLAVQATVGVILANLLLLSSFEDTSPLVAGVSFGTLPIVIGGLSFMLLREPLPRGWLAAALLASLGTIFLTGGDALAAESARSPAGGLNALGAVMCIGIFTIISKQLSPLLPPIWLSALVTVICLLLLLPFTLDPLASFEIGSVGAPDWLALAWWALASGVAYPLLLYTGLRRTAASDAGILTVVVPLTAALASYLLLGEVIGAVHAVGTACAAMGVIYLAAGLGRGLPAPMHRPRRADGMPAREEPAARLEYITPA